MRFHLIHVAGCSTGQWLTRVIHMVIQFLIQQLRVDPCLKVQTFGHSLPVTCRHCFHCSVVTVNSADYIYLYLYL